MSWHQANGYDYECSMANRRKSWRCSSCERLIAMGRPSLQQKCRGRETKTKLWLLLKTCSFWNWEEDHMEWIGCVCAIDIKIFIWWRALVNKRTFDSAECHTQTLISNSVGWLAEKFGYYSQLKYSNPSVFTFLGFALHPGWILRYPWFAPCLQRFVVSQHFQENCGEFHMIAF